MTFKLHPLVLAILCGSSAMSALAVENLPATQSDLQSTNPAINIATASNTRSSSSVATSNIALPTLVIKAHPLNRSANDFTTPVNVLTQQQLATGSATLGEALEGQVGVRADTFGAGASRPVIRGQTAPRVKVLSDGSEVMDASAISPDHAVTVDPLLADKIEILRGPSTLLYGSGAVGGVVNVVDQKIPAKMPYKPVEGQVSVRLNSVANENAKAVALTTGLGDQFALHVEGLVRDADEYKVPNWSEDKLTGSYSEGKTGSIGLSWINDQGYAGLAYTQRSDKYGLPGHSHEYEACHPHGTHLHCDDSGHSHDDEEAGHDHALDDTHDHDEHDHDHAHEAAPWVNLDSKRVDFRAEYKQPFAGFERIKVRAGYTDYQHDEIEEGEVATSFKNKGYDGRIELTHVPVAGWQGVIGTQFSRSDFRADGEEAFLPQTITKNLSAFFLEHYQWQDVHFELGARHEWQTVKPKTSDDKFSQQDFDDSATSASVGATWEFRPHYALSLSVAHSERMPNAQELYANGGHFATNTYEIGNAELSKEKSNNIELGLRKTAGKATFAINAYHNEVSDYIYANTLDRFENFRLINYAQQDATFNGVEAETSYKFNDIYTGTLLGDYVRGQLDSATSSGEKNLPRIPAARLGGRLQAKWDALSGQLEYYHVMQQDDIADFENRTPSYNLLNAGIGYEGTLSADNDYRVYLQLNNLLDEKYFNHSSFLANLPQPGRNLTAGVQFKF